MLGRCARGRSSAGWEAGQGLVEGGGISGITGLSMPSRLSWVSGLGGISGGHAIESRACRRISSVYIVLNRELQFEQSHATDATVAGQGGSGIGVALLLLMPWSGDATESAKC